MNIRTNRPTYRQTASKIAFEGHQFCSVQILIFFLIYLCSSKCRNCIPSTSVYNNPIRQNVQIYKSPSIIRTSKVSETRPWPSLLSVYLPVCLSVSVYVCLYFCVFICLCRPTCPSVRCLETILFRWDSRSGIASDWCAHCEGRHIHFFKCARQSALYNEQLEIHARKLTTYVGLVTL